MTDQDWTQDYRRLWKELVPRRGQAKTVQGELIRCIGKLTDEAYRNGNENWDENFELMVQFVGKTLDDGRVFSADERANIRKAVAELLKHYDSPDVSGRGSCYYYLAEKAVKWCIYQNELMPRDINPALRK